MAKKCCVPECYSYKERHILVHRFPTNSEKAELWRKLVENPQLHTHPVEELSKRYSICTNHFRMDDYKSFSRKLKPDAHPSLNLPNVDEQNAKLIASAWTFRIPTTGIKRKRNSVFSDELSTSTSVISSESGISSPSNFSTDFEDMSPVVKITRSFKKEKNCSRAYHKYLCNNLNGDISDNSDCECEAINDRSHSCSPAYGIKKDIHK